MDYEEQSFDNSAKIDVLFGVVGVLQFFLSLLRRDDGKGPASQTILV
jgi:hypothetical protein